ncbi:MAG: hypothetical protein C4326_14425 [Ignavibacteria bacterium]
MGRKTNNGDGSRITPHALPALCKEQERARVEIQSVRWRAQSGVAYITTSARLLCILRPLFSLTND